MSIDYEAIKNFEARRSHTDHDNDPQEVSTMIQPPDAHRLEIAQDVLGCLIALRSELIFYERKKAQPNVEIISQWKAERNTLFDLTRSLNCKDRDTIENVIATYGPSARALFDSGR
jgi:hypothetical protein